MIRYCFYFYNFSGIIKLAKELRLKTRTTYCLFLHSAVYNSPAFLPCFFLIMWTTPQVILHVGETGFTSLETATERKKVNWESARKSASSQSTCCDAAHT